MAGHGRANAMTLHALKGLREAQAKIVELEKGDEKCPRYGGTMAEHMLHGNCVGCGEVANCGTMPEPEPNECPDHPEATCGECGECDKHKELVVCYTCHQKARRIPSHVTTAEELAKLGKLQDEGKMGTVTIQIIDGEVSRKHLQIRHEEDEKRHYAADYRSANGVFINGNRIIRDVPLVDGDKIRIGTSTLVYTTSDFSDTDTALDHVRKIGEWKRSTLMHD